MQGKRMRGEAAKQVAIDVVRAAGEPLHTKEITKRVIESGRSSGLKGKTPEATVAAMLAVGSKPGVRSSARQGHLHARRRSRRVGDCQAEEARGEAPPEANVRKRSEANVAERSDSGLEFIPEGSNNGA